MEIFLLHMVSGKKKLLGKKVRMKQMYDSIEKGKQEKKKQLHTGKLEMCKRSLLIYHYKV